MIRKYRLYNYDVWGNNKEGYNVNNVFQTDETCIIDDDMGNGEIIAELKKQGIIRKTVKNSKIDISDDGYDVLYFDYRGKPEFELREV